MECYLNLEQCRQQELGSNGPTPSMGNTIFSSQVCSSHTNNTDWLSRQGYNIYPLCLLSHILICRKIHQVLAAAPKSFKREASMAPTSNFEHCH
jgi:hypothetical protein